MSKLNLESFLVDAWDSEPSDPGLPARAKLQYVIPYPVVDRDKIDLLQEFKAKFQADITEGAKWVPNQSELGENKYVQLGVHTIDEYGKTSVIRASIVLFFEKDDAYFETVRRRANKPYLYPDFISI